MQIHDHPLAAYRKKSGLTQTALAGAIGISRWTINQIEMGRYTPSIQMCLDIEGKTGVSRAELRPDLYAGFVEVAAQ